MKGTSDGADGEPSTLTRRRFTLLAGAVVSISALAGCSSLQGGDGAGGQDESTERTGRTTEESGGARTTEADESVESDGQQGPRETGQSERYDWEFVEVDRGVKPALALDSQGRPHVQYMFEARDGWVREAFWDGSVWTVTTVAEGYFYGPGDIDIGPDDVPRISYHDHQGLSFDPSKGDATFAFPDDEDWTVEAIDSSGHDGWDNRVYVAPDGEVHISAVDPRDFDGIGVEYFHYDGTEWTVEAVGGPAVSYGWGTSVGASADGTPQVVFYDDTDQDLVYATRPEGTWERERVDTDGDVGMFPDVVVDAADRPHVSYLRRGDDVAELRYARLGDDGWNVETVDSLPDLLVSRAINGKGARNTTSIVLDEADHPTISYSDERRLKLASLGESDWQIDTVREAGEVPLGQITSLRIDTDGVVHLSYSTVAGVNPLIGGIWYASGTLRQ